MTCSEASGRTFSGGRSTFCLTLDSVGFLKGDFGIFFRWFSVTIFFLFTPLIVSGFPLVLASVISVKTQRVRKNIRTG